MEPHQGEMTCLDCPPMKKPVRSVFVEGDRFIHHVLWQHQTTEERALKTVAFQLLDGPCVMDKPYHHQSTSRYLLRFASDPFPEGFGPPDTSWLDYYGWVRDVSLGSKPPTGVQRLARQPHRRPPASTFSLFLKPTCTAIATQQVASALKKYRSLLDRRLLICYID